MSTRGATGLPQISYDKLADSQYYIILKENKRPITNGYFYPFEEGKEYNVMYCGMGTIEDIKDMEQSGFGYGGKENDFSKVKYLGLIDHKRFNDDTFILSKGKYCPIYHVSGIIYVKQILQVDEVMDPIGFIMKSARK